MSNRDDIKVQVGAEASESVKGTFDVIREEMKEFRGEALGIFAEVVGGAGLLRVAFSHITDGLTGKAIGDLGLLALKFELFFKLREMFIRSTAQAKEGLSEYGHVEDIETQFRSLLKTTSEVKARMAELRETSAQSPFKFEDVAGASKVLELMTRGQLSSGGGLQNVLDLAARTGQPVRDVAEAIGHLYQTVQAGEPLGRAARQLETMGVMSEQDRLALEKLQSAGLSAGDVWDSFAAKTLNAQGAAAQQAQTLTTLTDKLAEAKEEETREVGSAYVDDAKENVKATTDLTRALTPLHAEAAKIKDDFGLAGMPTQTFPLFDTQIKQLLVTIFSLRAAWTLFLRGAAITGAALGTAVIVSTIGHLGRWIQAARSAAAGALEWAAAQKVSTLSSWTSTEGIKANTVALIENNAAQLRARAVLLAQSGITGLFRSGLQQLTGPLMTVLRAAGGLPAIIVATASALYMQYRRVQEQIKAMQESRDAILQAVDLSKKERDGIVTVSDKIEALTKQYERLAEARKRLADAPDAMQRAIAQQGVTMIDQEISRTETADSGRPSQERQRILDETGDLQEKQLDRDLSAQDQLVHLEGQRTLLAQKRAELQKKADDAAAAADPKNQQMLRNQIAAMEGQLAESQKRVSDAELQYSRGMGRGRGRSGAPELNNVRDREAVMQQNIVKEIADLQKDLSNFPAALQANEAAQTDLAQNDLQQAQVGDKTFEQRRRMTRDDFESKQRQEEADAEKEILDLQTRGVQRTIDEAHIRQNLAAQKSKEAQDDQARLVIQDAALKKLQDEATLKLGALKSTGEQRIADETAIKNQLAEQTEQVIQQGGVVMTAAEQRAAIIQSQNEYLQQQHAINEAIIAQNDEQLGQEERKTSRILSLIGKLPHNWQKPLLENMTSRLDQQSGDFQARADKARAAGDTSGANQWQDRAEAAGDQAAELRDQLAHWSTMPSIVQDEAHRMGEGGRMVNYGAPAGSDENPVLSRSLLAANPSFTDGAGFPGTLQGAAIPSFDSTPMVGGDDPLAAGAHHQPMIGGSKIAATGSDLIADRIATGNKTLERIEQALRQGHGGVGFESSKMGGRRIGVVGG